MSGPRICAVFGARGPGGNTWQLLERTLDRARSLGAETAAFSLLDHPVLPIRDCRRCDRYHGCTERDQGPFLLDRMLEADTIVLASPIYWSGPSAQLKAFIDRWTCVPDAEMKRRIAGKQLVGIAAYGIPDPGASAPFRAILENLTGYFALRPLDYLDVLCERHGDGGRPEALAAADALATRLVRAASAR